MKQDGNAFEVRTLDRTFYIQGESTDELVRWVRCLRGVRAFSAREDVKALQAT